MTLGFFSRNHPPKFLKSNRKRREPEAYHWWFKNQEMAKKHPWISGSKNLLDIYWPTSRIHVYLLENQ
jgi:hypothetical protein